jgi:Insertion element 4 transposase N-terminal/Transposase DDE domain
MHYRLRHLDLDDKMCQHVSLHIVEDIYPQEIICEQLSLHDGWEERERALNMFVVIHLVLAAALWTRLAFPRVLERLARPLHVLGLPLHAMQVSGSAISYRRHQLGVAPLQGLFARCCRPLCTPATLGAYRFGTRLMALDGTMQDVADTPATAAEFSRPSNQYGQGPFPQIRLLVLTECGSHATVDATISDGTHAERRVAEELLPSLAPDMFLLHDAQLTGLRFWHAIRARRAHVLAPLPSHHLPTYLRQLSDGSYVAVYLPSTKQEHEGIKPLLVRVIEYRITDARLGEPDQIYRLATTWLNPRTAPALALIDCYHERWEVEIVLDEIKTHQRLQQPVLRSRTPEGVRQEVYALFLAQYAVRVLMHRAACQAGVDPDRLSFTDALFVLCETTRELAQVEREQQEPVRQEMDARLTSHLLPPRRLRAHPRVLKKLSRKYKRKSHDLPAVPPFHPKDMFLDFVVLLI